MGKRIAEAHSISNLRFSVPNEIPVVFYNSSNYDYHFIIKELGNEFEGQFECLVENTKKYKTFSIPVEIEIININKNGNESVVAISYKIRFIDSARFIVTYYQILLITSQKEFIKLNAKIVIAFLNLKVLTII